MGFSTDATGYPTFDDNVDLPADLQGGAAYAKRVGGVWKGTSSERTSLTAGETEVGWLLVETDTESVYVRTAAAPQGVVVLEDTGWIDLPFSGSPAWENFGGAYATAKYRRRNGVVSLRGTIKNASAARAVPGQVVATLPIGFRPAAYIAQPVIISTGDSRSLEIGPAGQIVVGASPWSEARVHLDGVSFVAEG